MHLLQFRANFKYGQTRLSRYYSIRPWNVEYNNNNMHVFDLKCGPEKNCVLYSCVPREISWHLLKCAWCMWNGNKQVAASWLRLYDAVAFTFDQLLMPRWLLLVRAAVLQFLRRSSVPHAADTDDCNTHPVLHARFSSQCCVRCCLRRTAVLPGVACCSDVAHLGNADECDTTHSCFTGWLLLL